jgi:hypothetical protein
MDGPRGRWFFPFKQWMYQNKQVEGIKKLTHGMSTIGLFLY